MLTVKKSELAYNALNHRSGLMACVEPCAKCIQAAKQTPEDWLPGFGAY